MTNLSPYRNELWMIVHHDSLDPFKASAMLRIYLDESGGDDPGTPHAVVGGMVIDRESFLKFEDDWDRMLERRGIHPPLHMKEFGRNGRLGAMSRRCREEVIAEAVGLIKKYRAGSISVSLSNADFKMHLPGDGRRVFGVYGMCFSLLAILVHQIAVSSGHRGVIPYILDDGNAYKKHVVVAHSNMRLLQRQGQYLHVGSLTFDDDALLGTLQAADLIAWGARRRATGISLKNEFASVGEIFSDAVKHAEWSWENKLLRQLGEYLTSEMQKAQDEENEGV